MMEQHNELEDFRKQWERELLNQKSHSSRDLKPGPNQCPDEPKTSKSLEIKVSSPQPEKGHITSSINDEVEEQTPVQKRPKLSLLDNGWNELIFEGSSGTPVVKSTTNNDPNRFANYLAQKDEKKECFLDIFLADLDEINEIPFFDMELPREVAIKIFQHLDIWDLCACAQVSKAWKSLAEDELLWCRICHRLGYEKDSETAEKEDWKNIVREAMTMEQTLTYNWKNRVGGIEELQHIPGGVLTAVSAFNDWVVSGYTSLEVKLWNLKNDTECVLSPSTRALTLQDDNSFVNNHITHIDVNDKYCVARFGTGMVNVWENNSSTNKTEPVYSYSNTVVPSPTSDTILKISPTHPTIAVSCNNCVRVDSVVDEYITEQLRCNRRVSNDVGGSGGNCGEEEDEDDIMDGGTGCSRRELWTEVEYLPYGEGNISDMLLLSNPRSTHNDVRGQILVVAIDDLVRVHKPSMDQSGRRDENEGTNDMTELYHTAFEPVEYLDWNSDNELALCVCKVDVRSCFLTSYQVKLYSLDSGREVVSLKPQRDRIHTVNLRDSPKHLVFTGGYQRLQKYDLRIPDPVLSIKAHSDVISQIQADDWKIVSGGRDGYVCVWDQRMATKLWDMHNRHPVKYVHFNKHLLLTANIPTDNVTCFEQRDETMVHKRYRGSLNVYDFSISQQRDELPSICQSTFDEPQRYNYNVRLAVPYDNI